MNGTDDMIAGTFEPQETALVRDLLRRCDRFIDIGANTGYYCLLADQAGVETLAIEPVPQTVQVLMQNLRANGIEQGISILPVAVSDKAGMAEIFGLGTGSSLLRGWANNPETLSQIVPVVRLDDVAKQPENDERLFILMDVEGYEYPALMGAKALVNSSPRPVWMIEIAPSGAGNAMSQKVQETFDFMALSGYTARTADDRLDLVHGPVSGTTNYLFHDSAMCIEEVLGPESDRTAPYSR